MGAVSPPVPLCNQRSRERLLTASRAASRSRSRWATVLHTFLSRVLPSSLTRSQIMASSSTAVAATDGFPDVAGDGAGAELTTGWGTTWADAVAPATEPMSSANTRGMDFTDGSWESNERLDTCIVPLRDELAVAATVAEVRHHHVIGGLDLVIAHVRLAAPLALGCERTLAHCRIHARIATDEGEDLDLLTNTLISLDGAGSCCPLHQLVTSSNSMTEMLPSFLVQTGIYWICCLLK